MIHHSFPSVNTNVVLGFENLFGKVLSYNSPLPPSLGLILEVVSYKIGTLRSDDRDGNKNVKKAKGLITKTTILQVHHAFLYICLPSLHDYDGIMPNFTFYRGSTKRRRNFLSLSEVGYGS